MSCCVGQQWADKAPPIIIRILICCRWILTLLSPAAAVVLAPTRWPLTTVIAIWLYVVISHAAAHLGIKRHSTAIAMCWNCCYIALCVRLNRKWEIGIFTPQHPFFPGIIISDKLFGACPLSSFTFDIYLGTSWIQPTAEEIFTLESVSIQASCRKDLNRI